MTTIQWGWLNCQTSYTWSYFDFYFLGIGEKWEVRSILVETLKVAYLECGKLWNLHERISFIHIVAIHYKEGFFLSSKLSSKGGGWGLTIAFPWIPLQLSKKLGAGSFALGYPKHSFMSTASPFSKLVWNSAFGVSFLFAGTWKIWTLPFSVWPEAGMP